MSLRRSATEAQATRGRILGRAAEIASEEGLDGITIGRLAEELEMSKSRGRYWQARVINRRVFGRCSGGLVTECGHRGRRSSRGLRPGWR